MTTTSHQAFNDRIVGQKHHHMLSDQVEKMGTDPEIIRHNVAWRETHPLKGALWSVPARQKFYRRFKNQHDKKHKDEKTKNENNDQHDTVIATGYFDIDSIPQMDNRVWEHLAIESVRANTVMNKIGRSRGK